MNFGVMEKPEEDDRAAMAIGYIAAAFSGMVMGFVTGFVIAWEIFRP